MAVTPETKVKEQYVKAIQQYKNTGHVIDRPYAAGKYGEVGWPDRDGCVCGLAFYVEFKASNNAKVRGIQQHRRRQIVAAGGTHFYVYDDESLNQFIEWLDATVRSNTK